MVTFATVTLGAGSYKLKDILDLKIPNDAITSIKIPPGYKVTAYEHNYHWDNPGNSVTFTTDTPYVGDLMYRKISSLVIQYNPKDAGVVVYADRDFQSKAWKPVRLFEGEYDLGRIQSLGIKNDDISSIKIPPGYIVTVYEHNYWQPYPGLSTTFTSDTPYVGDVFDPIISSLRIKYDASAVK
jgi:hypothetical protein